MIPPWFSYAAAVRETEYVEQNMASQPSMPNVHSCIKPNAWLFLRLPNEMVKCIEIKPNQ